MDWGSFALGALSMLAWLTGGLVVGSLIGRLLGRLGERRARGPR